MLSTVARRYPFFPKADDMDSLNMMAQLLGWGQLKEAAKAMRKTLETNLKPEVVDFDELVKTMRYFSRRRSFKNDSCLQRINSYPPETGYDEAESGIYSSEGSESPTPTWQSDDTNCLEWFSAVNLLKALLAPNPHKRLRPAEALQHDFIIGS